MRSMMITIYPTLNNTSKKNRLKKRFFLYGAFRRGNNPPVQPGENKKVEQKKNLQV